MNQSELLERIEAICEEFDTRMRSIGLATARLVEIAKVLQEREAENTRLRTALEDIANPLQRIKREMPEGYKLDGHTTTSLFNSVEFYKDIARQALKRC